MRYRRRVVQEGGVRELERAYRSFAGAEERLRREVLLAHEAGSSLRTIASVVDMSPESVRGLIAKTKAEREHDLAVRERLVHAQGTSISSKQRAEAERRALAAKWRLSVQTLDR
jgi:hypothetical protein